MPNPDLVIWGLIAIAVVLLWPIRNWMRRRYDRDAPDDGGMDGGTDDGMDHRSAPDDDGTDDG